MAPRKRLYKLEDAVEMVFADSPSEDEDLLQPQSDPDYEFRERPVSNGFWITAINICLIRATTCIRSAYSCPRAINIQATPPDNDRGRTRVAQQRGEGPNTRATEVHASQGPRASVGHHCTMDPNEATMHMAALISEAYLHEARAAMATETPAIPPKKKRKSRKRPLSNPVDTRRRERQRETQRSASAKMTAASQDRRYDPVHEEGLELEHQDFGSLDVRMKTARPMLFNANLSAERIAIQKCHRCCAEEAVIRCLDCVPLDMEFLCATCDMEAHKRNIFHDREAVFNGFLEPIPPTTAVVVDENGQPQFCEQICQLPVPTPRSICECSDDVTVTPWKHISVVTINGRYNVCLPRKSCPSCSAEWTPEVKDLLLYRYWPASTSCQTLCKYDVFTSFEHMKVTAPAMSRQAFLKMLEHRSVQAGRTGSICADTFQRSFFEFCFCQYKQEDMCQVHHFVCPACSQDMLAVCCDGNRKHYRFSNSKGTEEPRIYEGLFLAKDEEVATFVDLVRGNMKSVLFFSYYDSCSYTCGGNDSAVCGTAKFTAGREMSKKSGAQIDEEGIQVAVCRHGFLLRGLNHFRGEIYAYPMFLQKEMSKKANVDFFCMDVTCRYWPYLNKIAEGLPELLPLTEMRPFLSVMHAKAHTAKCEVHNIFNAKDF
ncbi:hypothetical protein F7725_021434 [Dissostichus mawsoni]|uniref:CxC3 like cysteine cluster domain-containing protein n=1 Tax=Dissostichus mawsoni TaxID=36200 RepID=A0A7J5ZB69_DISMA|nr:hypothetical protein F7725_021434 [Dissostichus mawsoni]